MKRATNAMIRVFKPSKYARTMVICPKNSKAALFFWIEDRAAMMFRSKPSISESIELASVRGRIEFIDYIQVIFG